MRRCWINTVIFWLGIACLLLLSRYHAMGVEQQQKLDDAYCEATGSNDKSSCNAEASAEGDSIIHVNPHTISLLQVLHQNASTSSGENGPVAAVLLMRHAERPPITPADGPGGLNVLLTENGKRAAAALGRRFANLPFTPQRLYSSPVKRCQETLEQLISGAGWEQSFEVKRELFGEGHLYTDPKLALQAFAKSPSIKGLFKRIVEGEELPGLVPLQKAAPTIVDFMRTEMEAAVENNISNGVHQQHIVSVMLSHDVNLAFLIAHYFGVSDFSGDHWPNFLEAIALVKIQDKYKLIWRDKEVSHDAL